MKCRKLPNGNWECYEEGPRDPLTRKRNAVRKQAKKKTDAQKKVAEALKRLETGLDHKTADRLPFEEFAWQWYEVYRVTGVKNSTIRTRYYAIRTLSGYIGTVPIGRVTHGMLQEVLLDLDRNDFSRSLLNSVKVAANLIFKHAIKHRLRKDNPVTEAIIPTKRLTIEEIEQEEIYEKYFEQAELERFLQAAVYHGYLNDREWFYLLAFTGMRVGEALALKWNDIDFEQQTIRITKTLDNPNGNMRKFELTPPKTMKSIRTIDVDPDLLELLKKHKARQSRFRLRFRKEHADYHDGHFVFARDNGYPYNNRLLYSRTVRLCKLAGLSKREGPHIIRHTYITMLAEAGVDLPTIMDRVGHEDSKTTSNIYMHITKKMKKDATQQVHAHFGGLFHLPN